MFNSLYMRFNAPKRVVFYISLVLALLGLLGAFGLIPVLAGYSFGLMTAGYVLLAMGTIMRNM